MFRRDWRINPQEPVLDPQDEDGLEREEIRQKQQEIQADNNHDYEKAYKED